MAPAPKGPLNRYRLLSPSASLRVSPLCLGAMNFGNAWESFMGACDQKTTESILDYFYEQGGMVFFSFFGFFFPFLFHRRSELSSRITF